MLTPAEKAAKWKQGTEQGVDAAQASVNLLTEAPAIGAIAAKQLMKTNWLESVDSGLWEDNILNKTDFALWKQRTVEGWERNRNISDDIKQILITYFTDLDTVVSRLDAVIVEISTPNPVVNPLPSMTMPLIRQLVTSGLTKHQKALKNITDITAIVAIIAPTLINQFGFTGSGAVSNTITLNGNELLINGQQLILN